MNCIESSLNLKLVKHIINILFILSIFYRLFKLFPKKIKNVQKYTHLNQVSKVFLKQLRVSLIHSQESQCEDNTLVKY